ncbi:putative PMR5 domain, PC-Esterase, protein trichome birefringence-like 2 [Lupinus albus]|uniref:Putative PMR5 domain, PC-Esterase, protein trichome birefringence-like 2 n=1 Tax=Lupinus albus TaxID=3870 RepID=A0A6A4PZF2_LUPAL|nr:putative PMR5 domain, PC-Esterase, protein trichome birefringence-like 2 [Lupinus albus]
MFMISIMDSNLVKKLMFSEHFMSLRRKVLSGFSLGVGASLLFLIPLFLTSSLKVSNVYFFLHGSTTSRSNSSLSSWPFFFSSVNRVEEKGSEVGKISEVNLSKKGTHLGNFSESHGNASLHGEQQRFPTQNFSDSTNGVVKNVTLMAANKNISDEVVTQKNMEGELHEGDLVEKNSLTVIGHEDNSKKEKMHAGLNKKCDIFYGNWVRDESKPYYPLGSCPYIGRGFDCHLNGRPDSEYVKWKWQPNGCDIPSLNASDFLERLRGQKLVFVGDSLNRNMWESLACILRQSIRDKKRVFEISGKTEFKKKDFVSSPFIVQESSFKGINGSFETLRLDLMDQITSMYHDADIIVFNTGHWWTHKTSSKGKDYYQEGNHVYSRLKVLNAYTKALTTWAKWIDHNIDANRTQVFFRGYSLTHFRGGQWNSGGQCNKETEPIFNGTQLRKYSSKMRALDKVMSKMKTPVIYMNISRLTDYRKDGHPSIYRMDYKTEEERVGAELHQDCSHWCLPGVPDTWNELLYASLLQYGKGSWKT